MNKNGKIVIGVCTLGIVAALTYCGTTYYVSANNKDNNQILGMNESNLISGEMNSTLENNSIQNNAIQNNSVENSAIENTANTVVNSVEIQNTSSNKQTISSNNDSEVESDNYEEKAIEIVKKDWGSSDGVYFSFQTIDANGNYIISVNSSETTAALEWYTVNPKTGEFVK